MNAGGSVFWMALAVSLSLAGGATWWFLSPSPEGEGLEIMRSQETTTPSLDGAGEQSGEDSSGMEGERQERVEADVTFSFAHEVAQLSDGRIIEQDDLFRVSCRSAEGDIEWQYEMDSNLLAAMELDANDDGPREFLLVDSRQGVGLDPKGRPIPGFSIRPSSRITSFALVDYEGDGQERYLFGLADGRVLNHRNLGESTPGWRHDSKGSAVQAIAHLRTGRKDYICTVDEEGVVMLLKRNGQRRVRTPVQLHRQPGPRAVAFDIRSDIESSTIVTRNADGVAESRTFGEGVARSASASEEQLLQTEESRLPASE